MSIVFHLSQTVSRTRSPAEADATSIRSIDLTLRKQSHSDQPREAGAPVARGSFVLERKQLRASEDDRPRAEQTGRHGTVQRLGRGRVGHPRRLHGWHQPVLGQRDDAGVEYPPCLPRRGKLVNGKGRLARPGGGLCRLPGPGEGSVTSTRGPLFQRQRRNLSGRHRGGRSVRGSVLPRSRKAPGSRRAAGTTSQEPTWSSPAADKAGHASRCRRWAASWAGGSP